MMSTQFHPLTIASVHKETDNAVCVRFAVPEDKKAAFAFIPGQYLTLKEQINGEEVRRSYSICAGLDDGELRVAIKRVEGGVFSTWANESLQADHSIEVMPPQGDFHTQIDPENEKNYLCICAGSGITPVLSIIKTLLAREPKSLVTLLYGNQRTNTMMFRNELGFIKNRYLQRFHWINIFSREPQEAKVLSGHINNRKGGVCATCKARLVEGEVDMDLAIALEQDE